jgi:hypothetical protein
MIVVTLDGVTREEALEIVENVLDAGTLQDALNEGAGYEGDGDPCVGEAYAFLPKGGAR